MENVIEMTTIYVISVPDVPESSKQRIKAEAKKLNKTHASNLS